MFLRIFIFFMGFSTPFASYAKDQMAPLPEASAYHFSLQKTKTDSLIATWKMAPQYYLYKNRIQFKILSPSQAKLGSFILPPGIVKIDNILGPHQVYENQLQVSLPILNPTTQKLKLLVKYQGCADFGFCYPPVTKLAEINNQTPGVSIINYEENTKEAVLKTHDRISENSAAALSQSTKILINDNVLWALVLFFIFGVLLAFTPCVLPMIPILSGIIVGQKQEGEGNNGFSLSLIYVLSMAATFAIAGILVALLGDNIQAAFQKPWVLITFSCLFVLLALSLFGLYEIKLPQSFQTKINSISQKQKTGHYIGVATMGCLSTLIVSPCVSAPLVGALAYIGKTGNVIYGGSALFALGLGMGAPLLIFGTSLSRWLPKAGVWMDYVKTFFGILLLGVAIFVIARIIPGNITLFLWACLAILSAVFLGLFSWPAGTHLRKMMQAFSIVLLLYGCILIVGAAMGNDDLLKPLALNDKPNIETSKLSFIRVKTLSDILQKIEWAKQLNKPVLLDFYADWCVSCKQMAKNTFANELVLNKLNNFILLQVDVTANDVDNKKIEKFFKVIGPPTLLFFDKGKEISSARVVGEMGPQKFLDHLNAINK